MKELTVKEKIALDLIEKLNKEQQREVLVIGLINAYTTEQLYDFLKIGYPDKGWYEGRFANKKANSEGDKR